MPTPVASGRLPVAAIARRIGRREPAADTWHLVRRFAAVGLVSTAIHLGLFATLSPDLGSTQAANVLALLVATVANTALNRRWTFSVRGAGAVRHQLQGLAVLAVTWLATAAALGLLHLLVPAPGTGTATLVVALATAASTALRFAAMRSWMFQRGRRYSVPTNAPSSSLNTTTPVQSKPSTVCRVPVAAPDFSRALVQRTKDPTRSVSGPSSVGGGGGI